MFRDALRHASRFCRCSTLPPTHGSRQKTTENIQNRPLCVVAQYLVESPEIVGGVVYDFLRVGNADVDCVHYLGSEVAPVERLRDRSQRNNAEEYK